MFTNLRESFIFIEGNGHITIIPAVAAEKGVTDPLQVLMAAQVLQKVKSIARAQPAVQNTADVMNLTGLISNGEVTTIYVGGAWVPSEMEAFKANATGLMSRIEFFQGEPLADDREFAISVSRGLAAKLDRRIGGDVILMAPTVSGQINALDAQIQQLQRASMDLLEDKWVTLPLDLAQTLHQTDGASQVNLLLEPGASVDEVRDELKMQFAREGLDVVVQTWRERSEFYIKVERMFDLIFSLMFAIVSVIIVMSVVNTVSMSVLERTREIGTLRAMGARRGQIIAAFSLEGALLGIAGSLLGLVVLVLVVAAVVWADPHWTPPQLASPIPLEIYIVPAYLALSTFLLTLLSLLSGILPAKRIARRNIVEALGHA
jgi:putative ABC transport system permease protein